MLARGEWRATAVSQNGTRGYHLSGLYSPLGWKSWGDCAQEWVDAQDNVEKLQVFWNTVLGETWEDRGDSLDPSLLGSRTEEYKAEVPAGVRILTAAIDVQDDRLELKVKGYGEREESWLIAYSQHYGDPSQDDVWHEVDEVLQHRFKVEGGGTMGIDTTFVDSGGHHSDSVYKFCKARTTRRVFPLRGVQQVGRPIISNPSRNNKYRVPLYNIGVDAAKDTVFARLKIEKNGPGRMHYPKADWCDEEYFAMLTAERPVRKWVKRRGVVKEWVQMRPRNEAFDLEVYCLAALYTRGFAHLQKLLGVRNVDKAGLSQEEAAAENNKKTASSASAGATPAEAAQRPKWGSNRPTAARPKWGTAVS
jgi:phage terminase large subunit GpA-like protein